MKKYNKIVICFMSIFLLASCSAEFLDYEPTGVLSNVNVSTAENAESLVTAAYAAIGNDELVGPITHQWVYGSVRSDDAYKGGGGRGDVDVIDRYEQYNTTIPDYGDWMTPKTWTNHYKAISRANFALTVINSISEAEYPQKNQRQAELRFLRAHSHFMLKLLFKKVPYITENLSQEQILQTSNNLTNNELWDKIAEDFLFALNNLPQTQSQVGRANKNAAAAYLAKLRLYQAYEQNDTHQVVNINQSRLQEVIQYADQVIGKQLETDFGYNFLDGHDNGPESVWAVQFSINDGTNTGRVSFVTGLNSPHGTPLYGCCGFHLASQNMVNAFRTDANGLPLLDTFNVVDIFSRVINGAATLTAGVTIDPRIDHTVGIPGRPFKYKNTLRNAGDMVYKLSWARDPGVYGYFGNMKEQQSPDCSCYVKNGPFIGTSKNVDFIRLADVKLFKAEALIQLNRYAEALPIINEIRTRAATSTTMPLAAGASNVYRISTYPSFPSKEYAFKALMFERRLEFGMEGPRFFDLVRWGIAEPVLNAYINKEKIKRDYLSSAHFTAGRDEYYPIPQREIDFTGGLYIQNPGY
jgi:hypothetical protein